MIIRRTVYGLGFVLGIAMQLFCPEVFAQKCRPFRDTVGFCTRSWQVDSVLKRTNRLYPQRNAPGKPWKLAVCPHDDFAYAARQYRDILGNIRAKTVVVFAVSHKARSFGHENKIVFDSHDEWMAPKGPVRVSPLRNQLMELLPTSVFLVSDSSHRLEHSAEAMLPFLQFFNPEAEIVPVLIPYMSWSSLLYNATAFSDALQQVMKKNRLVLGRDLCLLISNDAVHYGDKDWGLKYYCPFGTDTAAFHKMVNCEKSLIDSSVSVRLSLPSIQYLYESLTMKENYKEYKRTWCGRYSLPFGLLVGFFSDPGLRRIMADYATSIGGAGIPVEGAGIGKTAEAGLRHWVGYLAAGYY